MVQRCCLPELVFVPNFIEIMVNVKAYGLSQLLQLCNYVNKVMFLVEKLLPLII